MTDLKNIIFIVWFFSTGCAVNQKNEVHLFGPDNRIRVKVETTDRELVYSVSVGGEPVTDRSRLGLIIDGVDLGVNARIISEPEVVEIDEEYAVLGNHAVARNQANEARIPIEASGKTYRLIVRVYNDGAGIRYTIPEGSGRIDGEKTSWKLPDAAGKIAWSAYHQSYEGRSFMTMIDDIPEGKIIMPPVTCEIGDYYISISEADCETFSDMALEREGNILRVAYPFSPDGWQILNTDENKSSRLSGLYKGERVSPWRTTIIARNLTELATSDLLTNLSPPPAEGVDFSWVQPGRALWQWWSDGAPKLEEQKAWFDAAALLKWEYYLIDDGWRDWENPGKDQWQLLQEVIDYGNSVGVKSLVWVDSKEMREAAGRRAYLERVKAAGAAGIKIDFIPDATPEIMQWYLGAMQDCAELRLLLNFHGCVKPTGLMRAYPNEITREAVRGNEYHMTRFKRVATPDHHVIVPFTRFLAGPADFTPVILDPAELVSTEFTWAHQFAQAIVYLSPVTHFADHYTFYLESPMLDLFQELPTVWDETLVLPFTEMGEVVGFARRKGNTWWVGVMNGKNERETQISFNFLRDRANASLIYDGSRHTSVDRRERELSPEDVLNLRLRPGGGFVARLSSNSSLGND